MEREIPAVRRVQGADGEWEVSEAYAWEPMRQAQPSTHLVFRGGGRELRAQSPAPLAELGDVRLAALLATAAAAAGARAERPVPVLLRQTRPARVPASFRLFPAFAAGG
jgi:hypothetical protein